MAVYEGDDFITTLQCLIKNRRITESKLAVRSRSQFVQEDLVGFQFEYRALAFRLSTLVDVDSNGCMNKCFYLVA